MPTTSCYPVTGAGLGLRRTLLGPLSDQTDSPIQFMEVAPENWMGIGGKYARQFHQFTDRYPFVCHGLSLSIGSPEPLDVDFVKRLKLFLDTYDIRAYSEHLTYCSDTGHLYDLMPIPFTEQAARYVATRIEQVQDTLQRRIAMENASYYAAPGKEMEEIDFINTVLEQADCDLLLDVNNIYVNSINHHYDPVTFLQQLPASRISYCHIAGHYNEATDLIVDTHGADVIPAVWDLLEQAYAHFGVIPTLLERDFNLPPVAQLLQEVGMIADLQRKWSTRHDQAVAHNV